MLSVEPIREELLLVMAAHGLRSDPVLTLPRRRRQFGRLSRHGALLLGYLLGFAAGARWGLASGPDRRWSGS